VDFQVDEDEEIRRREDELTKGEERGGGRYE